MKKLAYPDLITESESALRSLYKTLTHPKLQERCELLIWLKSGQVSTMKTAVELKGKSPRQGHNLWRLYSQEGLSAYLTLRYKKPISPLEGKHELADKLAADGFDSIKEAQAWILTTYGIEYTENGLGNYFRAQKIKLKTGRPQHPKKDEAKREAYKKNLKKK